MKTLNFLFASAVISIALVSCQKDNIEPQQSISGAGSVQHSQNLKMNEVSNVQPNSVAHVSYEVTIHLTLSKTLCNSYQVEVVDAFGRRVASPLTYDPARSSYTFYEETKAKSGLRVARLSMVNWPSHFICETELYTTPSGRVIQFRDGVSYPFDLYPKAIPGGEKIINKD